MIDAIRNLQANPRPQGVKKLFGQNGWRVRVRDDRILYMMDDGQNVIAIHRARHGREVYRH